MPFSSLHMYISGSSTHFRNHKASDSLIAESTRTDVVKKDDMLQIFFNFTDSILERRKIIIWSNFEKYVGES
jgi:hypothetical protein